MMTTKQPLSVPAVAASPLILKTLALFLLLFCLPCCFAQTDTNLLAVGDWSEIVTNSGGEALRGRLLVYDGTGEPVTNHARVYLELQNVLHGAYAEPIQVYFAQGRADGLHFEMRDQLDHPIVPEGALSLIEALPTQFWVTLPRESTVRLRADAPFPPLQKRDGLEIVDGRQICWTIPPNATNDFFLSATFTPSKDHPSPLNYHVWQGTLKLPKVKIPAKKP